MPGRCNLVSLTLDTDGTVWSAEDQASPRSSHLSFQDYLVEKSALFADTLRVRVPGDRSHSRLIHGLYSLGHKHLQVETVRPIRYLRELPAAQRCRELQVDNPFAPTHKSLILCPVAAKAYQLTATVESGDYQLASTLVTEHPAWPALAISLPVQTLGALNLLSDIADPRWYQHPSRPGRLSRLFSHLGINPRNIEAALGRAPQGPGFQSAKAAVDAWNVYPRKKSSKTNNYLFTEMAKRPYRGDAEALLYGTRRFVSLVTLVWLDRLSSHPEGVFCPYRFFRDQSVAEAFAAKFERPASQS